MNAATTLTGGSSGTKVIGALTTAAAVIAGIDPSVLPPSWLPYFMGIAGILTLVRGIVNTKNQQPAIRTT